MKTYRIAVIPGDGIGAEVMDIGVDMLKAAAKKHQGFQFEFDYFPWSCAYYLEYGKMMADDGIEKLATYDAIFLGAVGYPGVPDHISLRELLLAIRQRFDQYVNIRPIKLLHGAPSPLKDVSTESVDMLFIRENSEGEYAGAGDWLYKGKPEEVVLQTGVFSRKGTERIIRYAYETARRLGKTLTSVSKANALNYSMVFWDEVFDEVGKEYPDVTTSSYLVDAASFLMIKDPGRFEVVVTSNLFGDILTDLGAALAGGMGLAAGANVNPERTYPSMFEPVHGSAPDIAGKGIANPLATIWSASQLIEHLGYQTLADEMIQAIENMLIEGTQLTADMDGQATTSEAGNAVMKQFMEM